MKYTPVIAALLGYSSAVKLQHHHRHHHHATPLSNFQPWTRNNWESADQDADNSRASNDIPAHCIHNVAGHCGITSSKQVAQPTVYGPQPAGGYAAVYPINNMIAQVSNQATPLSNFQPWTRNNWESADQDADNSRASNDIPAHCIHNVAGHCGITSSKQVAQPTVYGPQPAGGYASVYPINNMIAQIDSESEVDATPLSNFQPWTRNNWESADQDADNSRASNDIPAHCIHNVAGHCGITSSKQVAQPTVYGPQPAGGFASVYPINNMIVQTEQDGMPGMGISATKKKAKDTRYVPYKYGGLKGFNIQSLEHCPDFNERMTLINGKTKAIAYPAKGFNCNKDYGL